MTQAAASEAQTPSRATAFAFWLRLGCISFGGPAGQIALMHEELVERRRWITPGHFRHALNYCMLLPGPEAQQLATYIGWLLHGPAGAIVAGGLFVLPSLLLLIGLSLIYMALGHTAVVTGLLYGIKPAVTALVTHAAWRLGKRALATNFARLVAVLAWAALALLHLPFPLIIGAAAVAGGLHARGQAASAPRPAPFFDHRRFLRGALIAIGLWAVPLLSLVIAFGWQGLPAQMARFFTQAALLTFGGAYAALPYVQQAAVGHFGWLSAGQMMDGLALGETTPGPLIIIVSFVGFVGGWSHALPGFSPAASGVMASVVVTYFTFLPSFCFIVLGAPVVEATQHLPALKGPLEGIGAAVVGVIANLGLIFATAVLWPQGLGGGLDTKALALGAAAGLALFSGRFGPMTVVLLSGLAGLGLA
jgi:chromate transporter